MDIDELIAAVKAKAQALVDQVRAEGRDDFTAEEKAESDRLLAEAKDLNARKQRILEREARLGSLDELTTAEATEPMHHAAAAGARTAPAAAGTSLGELVLGSPQYAAVRKAYPNGVPEGARFQMPPIQVSSFLPRAKAGEITNAIADMRLPQFFLYPELMLPPRPPLTVLGLITHGTTETDVVTYPQVTSSTDAAAIVAEGAVKPQSALAWELVRQAVETYAHWVPVTKQALSDRAQLRTYIDTFLADGVRQVVESDVVSKLYAAAPAAPAAAGLGLMRAARRAITVLQSAPSFVQPTGFLFSPAQQEQIDTARDAIGQFYGAGPFSQGPNTLWGLPRATSYLIPTAEADSGLVGDFSQAIFWDRMQATISASDSHADFFIRNLVAILGEMRGAFGVLRPSAFLKFDTTGEDEDAAPAAARRNAGK